MDDDLGKVVRSRQRMKNGDARRLRIAAHLSQREVGDKCEVTGAAVANWETGTNTPRGRPAILYARLLDDLAQLVRLPADNDQLTNGGQAGDGVRGSEVTQLVQEPA